MDVINSGTITGATAQGVEIIARAGGAVDVLVDNNAAGALITGGSDGVDIIATSTTSSSTVEVTSTGGSAISGSAGDGVFIDADGLSSVAVTVTNTDSTIFGTGSDGVDINAASGEGSATVDVTNASSITGTAGRGVLIVADGATTADVTVSNAAGSTITGSASGVFISADAGSGTREVVAVTVAKRPDDDTAIEAAILQQIAHRPAVISPRIGLGLSDQLHGPEFGGAGQGSHVRRGHIGVKRIETRKKRAFHAAHQVLHVAILFDTERLRDLSRPRHGNSRHVVPRQVDQHGVLRLFLRIQEQAHR